MRVMLVSINHHNAPIELRERFAAAEDTQPTYDALRQRYPDMECLVLPTCNRFELYAARPVYSEPKADMLRAFLAEHFHVPIDIVASACVIREQEQAVAHLFRVCCGLDSMVLGEPQILGQVKRAYESASSYGTAGTVLHRVFQQAITTAKQIRTVTQIDAGQVSIGSVASSFAKRVIQDLAGKTVVGIGAGETAELTLRHLLGLKPRRLWVVNRTQDKAKILAEQIGLDGSTGGVRPWDQLDDLLGEADVIVTCTSSSTPILTEAQFEPILKHRRGRPLMVIDLAVPRDAEPALGSMPNMYLYNLDDLQSEVDRGIGRRGSEAERCEQLVTDAASVCMNRVRHNDLGQLIRRLRTKLHELGDDERERTLRKLSQLGDADELDAALSEHTQRLINKILHIPLEQLDRHKPDAPLGFYAAALRRLFDLAESEHTDPSSPPDKSDPPA